MKHPFIISLFLLMASTPALAEPPKTLIEDRKEAELLLGKHLLADHKISTVGNMASFSNFGQAKIENINGTYYLEAGLECYSQQAFSYFEPRGGHIKIKGRILSIQKNQFTVQGNIKFFYLPDYDGLIKGRACNKDDTFTFSRLHAYPEDIDKDFWLLISPRNESNDRENQHIDANCIKYLEPVVIFLDRVTHIPEKSGCVQNISDFLHLIE